MSEDYLTVNETAGILSVSPRTIQRYCKQGRLNYRWIKGKRHKEIRIIPPMPISDLPGVKRKKGMGAFDYVEKTDFENTTGELKNKLLESNYRIKELEIVVSQLRSLIAQSSGEIKISGGYGSSDNEVREKAALLLKDFEKVRPVEKKLILKMAREIEAHREFLHSLGMNLPENDDKQKE